MTKINVDIANIIEVKSLEQVNKIKLRLDGEQKSQRKKSKELLLKQVALTRNVVILSSKYLSFRKSLSKQVGIKINNQTSIYNAAIQCVLFGPRKVGVKKSSYMLKTVNRHRHLQKLADDECWGPNALISECQNKNGVRGVVERYLQNSKPDKGKSSNSQRKTGNSTSTAAQQNDSQSTPKHLKITFKRLTGTMTLKNAKPSHFKVIIADLRKGSTCTEDLYDMHGNEAELYIKEFLKQNPSK